MGGCSCAWSKVPGPVSPAWSTVCFSGLAGSWLKAAGKSLLNGNPDNDSQRGRLGKSNFWSALSQTSGQLQVTSESGTELVKYSCW